MSEVTSDNSTSTPDLPPRKRARMYESTDAFKPVGSLSFRIDKFREFSTSAPGKDSMRHCDAKVSVRGLTFGLAVYPRCVHIDEQDPTQRDICMGIIVKCENASGCDMRGDGSWSCLASMTFRVKACLKSKDDHVDEFTHRFFSSSKGEESSLEWDDKAPLYFDYLIDPKRGLYNEKDNLLELVIEVSLDGPVGVMELSKEDIIQVNQERVAINKNQLALHSRYFHTMFYNGQYPEGQSGEYKVNIEAPATVEHFKRMLQTMYPENRPLDDQCVEGVLHLANRFLVADVESKCMEFLTEKSKKPALFKYRVADKYGYNAMKKHVLHNLKPTDFEKELFLANMAEYVQLGPNAVEAFTDRYNELFTPESDEEGDE